MPKLTFSVDSALLRELGERLVGKAYIALAELVKNGYDADATVVKIEVLHDQDHILVQDNGHGMTRDEFERFWMRVGTPHKDIDRESRCFRRRMTGSKGVGRLSAQFLASQLELITVPGDPSGNDGACGSESRKEWLRASVNWDEAVKAGELTSATVDFAMETADPPFAHGTRIRLTGLKQTWDAEAVQELARELWWLQPPFRRRGSAQLDPKSDFTIEFVSSEKEFEKAFNRQMRAILDIWTARLVGKNENGHVTLSLEFIGEQPKRYDYNIADFPHNQRRVGDALKGVYEGGRNLRDGSFEIRVFGLRYRQPRGISVEKAREYFWEHGGVHVYDSGFRLPFYGDPKNDWLGIEFDHSHRRFVSQLLPSVLQERYAETARLNFLPTLGRLFGVVNVSTSAEPGLDILITRDRLNEGSDAFKDLVSMVRYALDLYAYEEALRQYKAAQDKAATLSPENPVKDLETILERDRDSIPEETYRGLQRGISAARETLEAEQERSRSQVGLLGPLATAGIGAVAYQHELRKQFVVIQGVIERVGGLKQANPNLQAELGAIESDLSRWVQRARSTMSLFEFIADAENMEERRRYPAYQVIEEVKRQTQFLSRGIEVRTVAIPKDLLLPSAALAEWGALFQNVFTNAFNAMLDSDRRVLQVSAHGAGPRKEILVQDTGRGVDLATADELFEPFRRELRTSTDRRAMGYGGTGLGLTIVRLIAKRVGCSVGFVKPASGFNTAFALSWRESK